MKKIQLIITLLLASSAFTALYGQQAVTEKDLLGTWKLVIDIDDELEKAENEEESFLDQVILSSVSGLVSGIMDNIEIHMEFKPGGELKVNVNAFDEQETEYSEWYINEEGQLMISETESFSSEDQDYWLMDSGVLLLYEENSRQPNENVYMVKLSEK